MTVADAIERRRSVRTFVSPPTEAQLKDVKEAADCAVSPFGGNVCVKVIEFCPGDKFRPSTYGVISGANDYLAIGYSDDNLSKLSAGYIGEMVVLSATMSGLGTCWVGGTFKGSAFSEVAKMPEETPLKIVVPFGNAAERVRLVDRIMRKSVGSDHRKPFDRLFFSNRSMDSVPGDSDFIEPLRLMRLAPSACNGQPWRALVSVDRVDFYCKNSRALSMVDMGIGLFHFKAGCDAKGVDGSFVSVDEPIEISDGFVYVTSFKRKQ